ncbi:DUF6263 family protein [Pedobacter frigoris]|uniref:Uncharacterized protein n=1 Tax=Pedobacter frigoris TaxID=2571272 RepID=A0A4V5NYR0_9SPHI|nr:DUF6263 family protein [Pedobacter frigoris]TKC03664.1 hypothetical protein FA047_19050 [Pedobacter frigoris]
MKNLLGFLFAFVLCYSSDAQTHKLAFNLVKGKDYLQTTSAVMSINQTVSGQAMNINMTVNGKVKYNVVSIENDVYNMDVSYTGLSMKMEMPGGGMSFDSEKKDTTDIMSTILSKMKNKPFQVKMTRTGKILEVKNVGTLFDNILNGFPNISQEQKEQIKSQINQSYGDKAFKGNMEMLSAIFPDKAVAKGETWNISTQLEAGMPFLVNSIYKLNDVTATQYVISGDAKMSSTAKDKEVIQNGFPMMMDMNGTYTSTINVDKATGWVASASFNQQIKGSAQVKKSEQLPDGLNIPMEIKSTTTITGN